MFSKDPANLDALKTSQSHQPRNLSSKPGSKTSGVKVAGARKNQGGANGGEEYDVKQVEPQSFHLLADEPFIPSRGDSAQSTGCDTYMAVHSRLDVIEETVEKTVEHLEAEVKGLLGQLEELAWNLPPGPFSPIPDLLGDGDDRF